MLPKISCVPLCTHPKLLICSAATLAIAEFLERLQVAVRPPSNNVAAIPDEASASAIQFCDRIKINDIKKSQSYLKHISKKNLPDFAATTSVGTEHWFNWIVRWNGNKEAGTQEDNNIGSTENTVSTSDKRVEEVSDENKKETDERLYPRNLVVDSRTAETTAIYSVGEIMLILRESWREQYEKINGNFKQLNAQDQWTMNDDPWLDPKWKFTIESKSNTVLSQDVCMRVDRKSAKERININPVNEWNSEDMFLKKELWLLRENFYIMEQKIQSMDVESEAVYKKTNSRIDKLEKIVDALKTEKQYFVQTNRMINKKISRIYFNF
ncbi:uncharacterized protein LOC112682428 [Sipha flava]|uniref:Uncharacterized protein LOC112682428 n=1 Tax=Sipha flava TaxID=143950 RepID=A0A8B8FE06_9HEMI|nr:uncharacterized protein LOC112682428 [Sipha flava]